MQELQFFREMSEEAGDDHMVPISLARERLELLERTLRSDFEDDDVDERDAGWDTDSLRRDAAAQSDQDEGDTP